MNRKTGNVTNALFPAIVLLLFVQLTGCQTSSQYTSIQSGAAVTGNASEQTERGMPAGIADLEEVFGKLFMTNEGIASYYADYFHGRLTANGERFDMHELTAAHKTLPFGSMVRVTNLSNGRNVIVRINDRGPFIKGRIIDLSLGAAKKIGLLKKGITQVRIEAFTGETGAS